MTNDNCINKNDEQLFALEVFVKDVTLCVDKSQKKESNEIGIDLKFIDFPVIRIFQHEYNLTKVEKLKEIYNDTKSRIVNFNCGKTHLFLRNPNELISAMRSSPLTLDVYKIKSINICPYEIIKDSLGEAKIPLYGCLCDQVSMAINDINHAPKPYVIKNKFILLNQERMMSGMIAIFLRLLCVGKYSITEFTIDEKTLLFKNQYFPDEFRCTKVPLHNDTLVKAQERERKICFPDEDVKSHEIYLPPYFIIDLTEICRILVEQDGLPKDLFSKLKHKFTNDYKNDKEEYSWTPEQLIIDTSVSKVRLKSHLGNKPCYSVGCSGGLCIETRHIASKCTYNILNEVTRNTTQRDTKRYENIARRYTNILYKGTQKNTNAVQKRPEQT
ncbi:Protein aurora borealis [Vespula squamosa]|uniref:Protein aurora borealis n=1 Tax=Vespula squamosa TaxID=30214 RepID=A0ABD1ZYI1_VESSQ